MATTNGLTGTVSARAAHQAGANTESQNGSVKRVYTDTVGNVTHADVLVSGTTRSLVYVENSSGQRLYLGCPVQINYLRGSRFAPSITGANGSGAGSALAANSTNQSSSTTTGADLSGIPILLEAPDETVPDGYVVGSGANVLIETIDPVDDGGGSGDTPGLFQVSAVPIVAASLPDAVLSGLPNGTCVDLVDSYGAPAGMYRLDAANGVWRRRDAGVGAATVGSSGAGTLRARTVDGSVDMADVLEIIFPNGTLTIVSPGVLQFVPPALEPIDSGDAG